MNLEGALQAVEDVLTGMAFDVRADLRGAPKGADVAVVSLGDVAYEPQGVGGAFRVTAEFEVLFRIPANRANKTAPARAVARQVDRLTGFTKPAGFERLDVVGAGPDDELDAFGIAVTLRAVYNHA